ncbi:MAG: DUF3619 family protein [Rhodoferax sp.]|nr:DUF3619 family protein [Rhodoferax sp.]OIP21657.1 MAG: hypothetical protein AUK52_08005 [Comamonadaceae bacterium CG2_30_60_41]PIY23289.1 MAG: DUF3619 domain-containing protein [Comamonadaceae bacterium CG_4_10_14_3_um_filter_60_75]
MKKSKAHHRQDHLNPVLDAAGERLAQILLRSVDTLDPNTLQRLRAAREQAVEQHRMALVHVAQTGMSMAGHGSVGRVDSEDPRVPVWQRLSSVGMLIALLLGLWLIDTIQNENSLQDAAEVDRVLLIDDLPPAAYLDPGFKYFLKLSYPTKSR